MPTRTQIRNISQQALALPLPLKGVLSAGNEVITSLPKATLLELFNTSPFGSEFVELTDMPLTSIVTPGLEGSVDMGGSTFTNLAAPVNDTDAATKLYVDTHGGGGGGITAVTASLPLLSSSGATPDISLTAGTITGQVLTWNGSAWASAAPVDTGITQLTGDVTAGPGSGSKAATVARLQGNAVSSVAPSDGQVLTWNGSAWVPGAPASGGSGGGGQVYFLNAGTPAQLPTVNLPGTPAELGLTAEAGTTTITSAALPSVGFLLIAGFVTELNRPDLDAIPAGLWDFNVWISASSLTPNATSFRLKVYTYDGTNAPTLISTGATTSVYDPTQTIQYVSSAILPQTAILTTDRIYVEIEGSSASGTDTITVNFGGAEPSHVHTTLPSVAGTGIVHVINGVIQSPASPVDLTAGATEISGTLPLSNGGTGTSTVPANGQLLVGNGVGYSVANIGAGTGISVTNGAGTVTVANTGVTSVGASAPITSTGGATPTIGIDAATILAPGSMSAADKTKLNGITAGAAVASVGTTSPITNTGTATAPVVALTAGSSPGNVLTWNGSAWAGAAPAAAGITALTGDVAASGSGSVAATLAKIQGNAISTTAPTSNQILQWISGTSEWTPTATGVGLGSRVHLVVEGGAYASLQAAVDAASANDVILVGPKGTVASGSWGDVTFPVTKRLSVIGLNGARGTSVRIGKVTFSPTGGTGNINENEVFLRGLLINADFAGSQGVLFGGTALARLRMADCFVFNSGASGDCVVMNNAATGGGTSSTLQLDGCTIQTANATSVLLKNTSGYTVVRDCSFDGGLYSLQGVAGLVECFKSFFEMNAAAREAVRVESAQVTMTWCRIINSNATGIGANITTTYAATTALFGMNNSVFLVGGAAPTTPYCVKGVAGALYAYGQVTYGASPRCQNTLIFSQSAQVHTSVP